MYYVTPSHVSAVTMEGIMPEAVQQHISMLVEKPLGSRKSVRRSARY